MLTASDEQIDVATQRRAMAALDRHVAAQTRRAESDVRLAANAKGSVTLAGLASRTGVEYQMFDMFGPYTEVVAAGAFSETLAAEPMVLFTVNHGGLGLASTKAGDLTLTETDDGLTYEATLPLADPDVYALVSKVERGAVTESSMMFRIREAEWNEAMDRRTITNIDLDRGDVSAVLYGANPHTEIDRRDADDAEQRATSTSDADAAAAERREHAADERTDQKPRDDQTDELRSMSKLKVRLLAAEIV